MKKENWINVKDKLPEKDGAYLVFDHYNGQITVRVYNNYSKCWDDEDGDDYYTTAIDGRITHWMQLPKEP